MLELTDILLVIIVPSPVKWRLSKINNLHGGYIVFTQHTVATTIIINMPPLI